MNDPTAPTPQAVPNAWEVGMQAYKPPVPAAPSVDLQAAQLASMSELSARQAQIGDPRARLALAEAVHAELSAGGTGAVALGKTPDALRAEEQARALQPEPDVQPGVHAPNLFTHLTPELFASPDEALAFGEAASAAGMDPQMVSGVLQGLRNDPAIAAAVAGGDEAVDLHLQGVREFFGRLPGGSERLNLAVSYLNHLAARSPQLEATVTAALMSPDALSYAAWHAEQSGFRPPARR